jgi:8-oxo-dGTP pyrophosphatase MutT (NUDIX family)
MAEQTFCVYGVSAIIYRTINGGIYILLQERNKGDSPETGLLETPSGKVSANKSVYTVIREKVRSETGLIVTRILGENNLQRIAMNSYEVLEFAPFFTAHNLQSNYPLLMNFFICETTGEHKCSTKDASNINWISIHDLKQQLENKPEKFYPMVIGALKLFVQNFE